VKKWRFRLRNLPAGRGGAVAASAVTMRALAGVAGVVYGVSVETKVLSGISAGKASLPAEPSFFYPCGYQSAGSVWLSVAEDSVKKAKEIEATNSGSCWPPTSYICPWGARGVP
jgi:hypothetical protein